MGSGINEHCKGCETRLFGTASSARAAALIRAGFRREHRACTTPLLTRLAEWVFGV